MAAVCSVEEGVDLLRSEAARPRQACIRYSYWQVISPEYRETVRGRWTAIPSQISTESHVSRCFLRRWAGEGNSSSESAGRNAYLVD
jgi:hypothetical protein